MNVRTKGAQPGAHIEVHFAGEREALEVSLPDDADADDVADALVGCLDALTFDGAEDVLQERLGATGAAVKRGA